MKKGFTMIELIFVIVVLGILTTIAIPRLAATREDAEIATTVANLRTLVSDVSAYYTVKEGFGTAPNLTKWKDITNVPLKNRNDTPITDQSVFHGAYLHLGGTWCIGVMLHDRSGIEPANIEFFLNNRDNPSDTCRQALEEPIIRAFTQSTLRVGTGNLPGRMAID